MSAQKRDLIVDEPAKPACDRVRTCDCGAELYRGDCPACDPWPEDEFEDDFKG